MVNESDNSGESKEALAEARNEGRDQADTGSAGAPVHELLDSEEKEDARKQGFNEQRTADEAGESGESGIVGCDGKPIVFE